MASPAKVIFWRRFLFFAKLNPDLSALVAFLLPLRTPKSPCTCYIWWKINFLLLSYLAISILLLKSVTLYGVGNHYDIISSSNHF